jgi:hypothetical protein
VILGGYEIARLIAFAVATSLGLPNLPYPPPLLPMLFPMQGGWEEYDFLNSRK